MPDAQMSSQVREQQVDAATAAYPEAAGQALDRREWLERHPEIAAELNSFFAKHDRLRGPTQGAPVASLVVPEEAITPGLLGTVRGFGDYELPEEIARGGMGIVFKARQLSLDRTVALKMILAGQFASRVDVERFLTEARAVATLDHPSIVPVYDVGEHQGQHYFSMKFVEGGNLARKIGELRDTPREAALIVATVARAVHDAHQRGILHRDLKPANVLLDQQGRPHVTDFGLAKRVTGDGGLTRSGAIIGTPSYMAPEQASARRELTTAADVYSLGAILYECLTGRPPFQAETPVDTILEVLEKEPTRPRSLNPNVDRDLETICLKCLDKEPARRYGSAAALADDLERWLAGVPIFARRTGAAERVLKWARRRPAVAALLLALLLVGAIGVGGVAWQWRQARAADEEAAFFRAENARRRAAADEQAAENARQRAEDARQQEAKANAAVEQARGEEKKILRRADGLRLAIEASAVRQTSPGLSLLLAIEAVRREPNSLTWNVLHDALGDCREVRTLPGKKNRPAVARFSSDGRFLLVAGLAVRDKEGRVAEWLDASGKPIAAWRGYGAYFGSADLSPDGTLAAATAQGDQTVEYNDGKSPSRHVFTDRVVYLWEPATGKDHVHLCNHRDRVVSIRFSRDGKRVVTASWDRTARVWDATTGKELFVLGGHECSLLSAAFSPDGKKILTLGSGGEMHGHPRGPVLPSNFDPGPVDREGRVSAIEVTWAFRTLRARPSLPGSSMRPRASSSPPFASASPRVSGRGTRVTLSGLPVKQ
jgi:hypothetical protein